MSELVISNKDVRTLSAVMATISSAYFIEIIWHAESIPFFAIGHTMVLFAGVLLGSPLLIFFSKRIAKTLERKGIKALNPWPFWLIAMSLLVWFVYIIYGSSNGPWQVRHGAFTAFDPWYDDLVLSRPFGIAGLCITVLAWLYLNLEFFSRSKLTGLVIFIILFLLTLITLINPKKELLLCYAV